MISGDRYYLVWDGECGFCQRTVRRLKARDKGNLFEPVAFQAAPDPPVTEALKRRAAREVLVVSPDGRVWGNALAVFKVLSHTGWGWFARFLMLPPMCWIATLGYRVVAANRKTISRVFYKGESCGIEYRHPETND